MLFNLVPGYVNLSTYQPDENSIASLMMVLLKCAVRFGYALQAIRLLVAMLNVKLRLEKLKESQVNFNSVLVPIRFV